MRDVLKRIITMAAGVTLGLPVVGAALTNTDASGNPLRRAPTGHISNYDERAIKT
jgi:hypothetical protein